MNSDLAEAVALLQARISRDQFRNYWRTEVAEEALTLLLSEHRKGNSKQLIRNALRDARKKLSRRCEILSAHASEIDLLNVERKDEFAHLLVETVDFLQHSVSASDQALLELACCEETVDGIAVARGIPIKRMREKLSRARTRAWIALKRPLRQRRKASSEKSTVGAAPKRGHRAHLYPTNLLVSISSVCRIRSDVPLSSAKHQP